MDPNACMKRLLDAIKDRNEDECYEALEDLVTWLRGGGFPPVFTSEMAGLDAWGEQKKILIFHGPRSRVSIHTVNHLDDREGWELVEYTHGGERYKSYKLAQS